MYSYVECKQQQPQDLRPSDLAIQWWSGIDMTGVTVDPETALQAYEEHLKT